MATYNSTATDEIIAQRDAQRARLVAAQSAERREWRIKLAQLAGEGRINVDRDIPDVEMVSPSS